MSSRSREIAVALVRAILAHKLLPSTKLGERELSEIFDCSRIVVRQALIRVADEGLVVIERNRGAFVAQPTLKETLDIYEALTLVEQGVAALLIERMRGARLAELRHHVERQREALASGDLTLATDLAQEFHAMFVGLSCNKTIIDMYSRLIHQARLLRTLCVSRFDTCPLLNDHLKLIELMEKGKLRQVQDLIATHNRHVAQGYNVGTSARSQLSLKDALASIAEG